MGRFSKLETGDAGESGQTPSPAAVRARAAAAADANSPIYDHGYYAAEADRLFFAGEFEKALRVYSRAIQADHAQIGPWLGQVLCLVEMKQTKEALIWVKRGLELFPEEARMISLQGVAYAQQGMLQRGIGCSDYALQITAADPMVWLLRGQILTLADNRNAQACFDKAMETRRPGEWQVPMMAGMFLLERRKWTQAAEFLRKAVAENTGLDHLWVLLGKANEQLGVTQAALDAYQAALDLNPSNQQAQNSVARLSRTPLLVRVARRLMGR